MPKHDEHGEWSDAPPKGATIGSPFAYRYSHTDRGFCRIYYRSVVGRRGLRCFQEDRPGEFVFYICTLDGEPSWEGIPAGALDAAPPEPDGVAESFRRWLAR